MPAIETQAEADEKMVDLPSTGASVDVTLDDTDVRVNKEEPEAVETVVIELKLHQKEKWKTTGKKYNPVLIN